MDHIGDDELLPECGPGDPVIESWYRDPLDRTNPHGKTHIIERRENLERVLRDRGFSTQNRLRLITWLLKCNGYFKEFDATSWKYQKRRRRQERAKERREARARARAERAAQTAKEPNSQQEPTRPSNGGFGDLPNSLSDTDDEDGMDHDDYAAEDIDEEEQLAHAREMENHFRGQNGVEQVEDHSARSALLADREEDLAIMRIRERLHFWNIIYGDDLEKLVPNPAPVENFNYFRVVPRTTCSNHSDIETQTIMLANGDLVEDPTFGLDRPTRENATTWRDKIWENEHWEDKEIMDDTRRRRVDRKIRLLSAYADIHYQFSNGYRETWKEIKATTTTGQNGS